MLLRLKSRIHKGSTHLSKNQQFYSIYNQYRESLIISLGKHHNLKFVVTQLLGRDLKQLLKQYKQFTLDCTVNLAISILSILENIHKRGIIHRDLKPENLMIGTQNNQNSIYLIDFLVQLNFIKTHQEIIQPIQIRNLLLELRRIIQKDDLESLGFVLLYFLKGSLPRQNIKSTANTKENINNIGQIKQSISLTTLCIDLPKQFLQYFQYVKDLQFEELPDYKYLKKLFQSIKRNCKQNYNKPYNWSQDQTNEVRSQNYQSNILSSPNRRYNKEKTINNSNKIINFDSERKVQVHPHGTQQVIELFHLNNNEKIIDNHDNMNDRHELNQLQFNQDFNESTDKDIPYIYQNFRINDEESLLDSVIQTIEDEDQLNKRFYLMKQPIYKLKKYIENKFV